MSLDARPDDVIEIDWKNGHIWVADKAPLLIDKAASTAESISATRPSGEQVRLSAKNADAVYYPISDGAILKPLYRPLKAWAVMHSGVIRLPDGNTMNPGPGAILTEDDQTFQFVDLARFERDFSVVGHRGTARPETPFAT